MASRAPAKAHPRRTGSRFLLSGLAVCGECGRALVGLDAKSGKYSYYVCNSLAKKGAGACSTPYLNSDKFERLVISKIKEHILTPQNLTELMKLVNEEMDAVSGEYQTEMETINSEIGGVEQRLGNLYNAIEKGNIEFNLLKPRLQDLKAQHDKLLARKAELEGAISQKKIELANPETVKRYVKDLQQFIDSNELMERKSFIKSFVKEIKVTGNEGRIKYTFPIPPDNHEEEGLGVLPTVCDGGR
jgi:site-specific DNA recombinase